MTGFASISSSRGTVWYLLDTVVFYYCSWDDNKGSNATNYYYSYFLKRRVACTRSFFSTISRVKSQRVAIPVWVTIVPIGRLTSCYSGTTPFLVCRAPLIPLRPVLKRSIIVIIIIIITTTTGISTATRVENCADTAINPWATSWIRRLSNVGLRRAAFGPAPVCLPVIAKQTISWVPPPPSPIITVPPPPPPSSIIPCTVTITITILQMAAWCSLFSFVFNVYCNRKALVCFLAAGWGGLAS